MSSHQVLHRPIVMVQQPLAELKAKVGNCGHQLLAIGFR